MNYIILDLEWNQCPTGKSNENSGFLLRSLRLEPFGLMKRLRKRDDFAKW